MTCSSMCVCIILTWLSPYRRRGSRKGSQISLQTAERAWLERDGVDFGFPTQNL